MCKAVGVVWAGLQSNTPAVHGFFVVTWLTMLQALSNTRPGTMICCQGDTKFVSRTNRRRRSCEECGGGDGREECLGEHDCVRAERPP
ncbi:hypothetical protein F5141DRAFT_1081711 [Pisolithus sp. B1]|nr:hypothetical protein F5141DRAFT_1081711 [Pisolithus sp. B1]